MIRLRYQNFTLISYHIEPKEKLMGCDIHLHTEVKIANVWHRYGCPSVDRNYRVFAKMAG